MEKWKAVNIIRKLDDYARDYDNFEMGLPTDDDENEENMQAMIKVVMDIAEEKKSKHFNEKHKNTVELSEDAQRALQKAISEYKKTMLDLYPVGTHWMCTHGTRGKYEVEIKGFNFIRGGFVAENTKTHKTKIVHWSSLRSGA